jgi:hypothetical protein
MKLDKILPLELSLSSTIFYGTPVIYILFFKELAIEFIISGLTFMSGYTFYFSVTRLSRSKP